MESKRQDKENTKVQTFYIYIFRSPVFGLSNNDAKPYLARPGFRIYEAANNFLHPRFQPFVHLIKNIVNTLPCSFSSLL